MPALSETLLRTDAPQSYVVVKGDTLWDIAKRFLNNPVRWKEIWHKNPQVENPDLIFPGDTLTVVYINGKPTLRQTQAGSRVVKLSPKVRTQPWTGAIPTVPVNAIAPFLSRNYVLTQKEIDGSPYIVEFADEHIIGGAGQRIYVRNLTTESEKFHIVRPGKPFKDGITQEIIGYAGEYIGTAEQVRKGDPATLFINSSVMEAVIGDRIIAIDEDIPWTNFIPTQPKQPVTGSIIRVLNGVSQIGQYNAVVLDRGTDDSIEVGSVLRIDKRGKKIRDVITPNSSDKLQLPDEKAGTLMVFRTFPRISFALVMDATNPIHLGDKVQSE